MAILCKDIIDKAKRDILDSQAEAKLNLVKNAHKLVDELNQIQGDCQDIIDTFNYINSQRLTCSSDFSVWPVRKVIGAPYNCIGISRPDFLDKRCRIEYITEYTNPQCCLFSKDGFALKCKEYPSFERKWIDISNCDFYKQTDLFINNAIDAMQGFVNSFYEFKTKFINAIKS